MLVDQQRETRFWCEQSGCCSPENRHIAAHPPPVCPRCKEPDLAFLIIGLFQIFFFSVNFLRRLYLTNYMIIWLLIIYYINSSQAIGPTIVIYGVCSSYGVPLGSILGPVLFSCSLWATHHNVKYPCYANDTQLYISVSPDNPSSLNSLFTCLTDIII